MRLFLAAAAILVIWGNPGIGQEFDKKKLRQALELPWGSYKCLFFMYGVDGLYDPAQPPPDANAEIAKLKKAMAGDESDADRYRAIAGWLVWDGNEVEADKLVEEAVELYRQRLKADPADYLVLAKLGSALADLKRHGEAEAVLRRAIHLGAKDPKCWTAWADFLHNRVAISLTGGLDKLLKASFDTNFRQMLADAKISPTEARTVAALIDDAFAAYNKLVELAPTEAGVYYRRGLFRLYAWRCYQPVVARAMGAEVVANQQPLPPEVLADFQKAASLKPDDPLMIANAAMFILGRREVGSTAGRKAGKKEKGGIEQLPKGDREILMGYMRQLEKLKAHPNQQTACQAGEGLGFLHLGLGNYGAAEECARITLKIDPSRNFAWDLLTGVMVEQERNDDFLKLCQDRVIAKPTPFNYFLLAKSHVTKHQWEQADAALLAGLKLDPGDIHCFLGKAVMLLRQEDNASAAQTVYLMLDSISKKLGPIPDAAPAKEVELVAVAYNALYSDISVARYILGEASKRYPDDEYVKRLVQLVGK